MKKTFLALLGSAALLASYSASAADAVIADAPVPPTGSYVEVCDAFGAGYFYIPGSETCLKVGGAVEFNAGYDSRADESYAGVDAHIDFDTKADSEIGTIGTKLRLSTNSNSEFYNFPLGQETDIELAYITVGPAFFGYKETLFNDDFGYGDFAGVLDRTGNGLTVGFLQNDIVGGVYAGLALEANEKGTFGADYNDEDFPSIVGRMGLAEQAWGGVDVSAVYSETDFDLWLVKATADLKATDELEFRISAGYGENDLGDGYIASAAAKYAFTEQLTAFTGVVYADIDGMSDEGIAANGGVTYSVVKDLDLTGQVTYTETDGNDGWNSKFTLNRKF